MEHLISILIVIGLFLLGVVSPGPNFLVVTQQSLNNGLKAGVMTGLGVAFGDCIYAFAGLFGLATLMSLTGWFFGLVKILGGIYLIYLGISMLKAKRADVEAIKEVRAISLNKCFRLGLLTDLANPKTIIFFTSIFATTLTPETPQWVLACMLIGITATSIIWRIGLSWLFSRQFFRTIYMRFRKWIEMAFGVILIIFGIRLTSSAVMQDR